MIIFHNEELLDIINSNYTKDSLQVLISFLEEKETLTFHPLKTHLFPAAEINDNTQYTGYKHVWIRDNIQIAHAHFVLEKYDVAINIVNALMKYFEKYKYKFEDIIREPSRANNAMLRPHIRFDGETLTQVTEKWAHAQNDALGYFLWFYCKLINNSLIVPDLEECRIIALFPLYFQAIQYWEDADSGHWEEEKKIEASSIGTVKAGLESLLKSIIHVPKIVNSLIYKNTLVSHELILDLIKQGELALINILPFECNSPSSKLRRYDAALLFLIYPLEVLPEEMSDQIIWNVIDNLQGEHGIRRYIGDSFWAPDYKTKVPPEKRTIDVSDNMIIRDKLVGKGKEAQWCIFDSILSVIFGRKYQCTGNNEYIHKQTWYLNRSLGQLTGVNCTNSNSGFRSPELYYLEHGKYIPNDSTPLLWTQANLILALNQMKVSLSK